MAWWPLDDATNQSTILDLAGGNHGTALDSISVPVNIGSAPVFSLPDPSILSGTLIPVVTDPGTSPPRGALFLSGQGFVEVPHHPSLNISSSGITIILWTWPTIGSGGPQPLVEKYDAAGGDGYSLYLDPVGGGNFVLKFLLNGTVVTGPTVAASASSSDWRFVVALVDGGGNVTLSVCDTLGSCIVTPTVVVTNFTTTNTAPLWFGKSAAINPAAGFLATRVGFDEIELFDRGLIKAEVQQIYDAEKIGVRKCAQSPGGAEVCIFKFADTNGNGQPDPGENGLPGWQFTVSPAPLAPATNLVTTDLDGRICLAVTAPGTYTVTEIGQPGWTPTTPATQTVTVQPGQVVNLIFGNLMGCVTPPANMTAWWPLDETAGAIADDLAGVNNQGAHVNGPTPIPGIVAGALHFDGVDDFVRVADDAELNVGTNDFTLDAWVRTTSPNLVVLLDKRTTTNPPSPGPTLGYSLYLTQGRLGFQMAHGVGAGACTPTPTPGVPCVNYIAPIGSPNVADGNWHHVAAVVDRADVIAGVRLFVDGIQVFTGAPLGAPPTGNPATPANLDNTSDLFLGMRAPAVGGGHHFPGDLDEVELFHRALTQQEIQNIFSAGPAGKCKPPCQGGFQCPTNKTVECDAAWTFDPPTSTVPGCALQILSFTSVTNPLTPCGEQIVGTWQFVDCCGLTNSCTQTVTVLDTTPPQVNCPTNKTVECGTPWSFDPPTALDACCGTNLTITVLNTVTNTLGPCQQTITRTWEVHDCCGNTTTCSQTVTVVDTTPPLITCPDPIFRIACNNGQPVNSVVVHYQPQVSDNCPAPVTVSCTPPSGSFFPLGTNVVTCTATDACGNTSSCSFTVTVTQPLWTSFGRGSPDQPPNCYQWPYESAMPGPCLTGAYTASFWKGFDDPTVDRRVGVRWDWPANWNIYDAKIQIRLRPPTNGCAGGSDDDMIHLGLVSCTPPATWLWSRYLGTSTNYGPGLFSFQWCNGSGCTTNVFHLNNLPVPPANSVNLLPHMNTNDRLELLVEDDTMVDFVRLHVKYCPLPSVALVGGLEASLQNARLIHGPQVWVLAPEDPGASFGAEFTLGQAPGLLVLIEPLALAGHAGAHLELEALDAGATPGIGLRLEAGNDGQGRVILSRLPAAVTNASINLIVERNGVLFDRVGPLSVNRGDLLATFDAADELIELGVLNCTELRASVLSRDEDGSINTYTLRAQLADCCDENCGEGGGKTARLTVSGLPEVSLQSPGLQLQAVGLPGLSRPVIVKPGRAPSLLLGQNDQVVATSLDEQTGRADLLVSLPPTNAFAVQISSFFPGVDDEEPPPQFETNGTVKTQKMWLPANFRLRAIGEGGTDQLLARDTCVTRFELGTNGLWTLTLPEVGQPTEGQVQQVLLKGPAGPTSILPQPAPAGGVWLGLCPDLPPIRAFQLSDPPERLLICRFVWPQPVLFEAFDGSSAQATALEIHWRMPGDDGSLTGLGVEATGTEALELGRLEFGPQGRGLRIVLADADEDGRPDAVEVLYDADGGILEAAPTILGPWTPVADQFEQGIGRYTIPLPLPIPDKAARFYRVRY